MPTRHTTKGTPVVQFDPQLEVPPYTVFRRLKEGDPPLLIDVRPAGGQLALMGARGLPGPEWTPPPEMDVVLIDDDGAKAVEIARRLQAAGFPACGPCSAACSSTSSRSTRRSWDRRPT